MPPCRCLALAVLVAAPLASGKCMFPFNHVFTCNGLPGELGTGKCDGTGIEAGEPSAYEVCHITMMGGGGTPVCYVSTAFGAEPFPKDAKTLSTCLCPKGKTLGWTSSDGKNYYPSSCDVACPPECPYLYGAANDCYVSNFSKPQFGSDNVLCTKVGGMGKMPSCSQPKNGRCASCIYGTCTKCEAGWSGPGCLSPAADQAVAFEWGKSYLVHALDLLKTPLQADLIDQSVSGVFFISTSPARAALA